MTIRRVAIIICDGCETTELPDMDGATAAASRATLRRDMGWHVAQPTGGVDFGARDICPDCWELGVR